MAKTRKNWTDSLHENEKLLWTGSPHDTGIIDPENKYSFYISYAVAAVWIVASLVKIIPERPDLISLVIVELVPVFIILLPLLNAASLKKTSYAITDQRVIVNLGRNDDYSMEYDDLTPVEARDNGTICIGEAVGCKPRKERSIVLYRGIQSEDKECLGIVLYKTDDQKSAMEALNEKIGKRPAADNAFSRAAASPVIGISL